jgi:pimeloyl-ACP methyl ester carboxylesterase
MDLVDIGTGTVAYDRMGTGPAVVLNHASLVDRRMWRAQIEVLAHRFDVVAFDQLGYGQSSAAPAHTRPAHDLLRLLDALGIDSAALVGCSMGGGYSLDAALLAPDRVSALVLVCPGVPGYEWPEVMREETQRLMTAAVPLERLTRYAAHTAAVVRDDDVAAMAEMQARYMVIGPGRDRAAFDPDTWSFVLDMARGVFDRMWRDPLTDEITPAPPVLSRLGDVSAPTLVISGRADVPYIQDVSALLVARIPGADHLELADTGHLPPLERPDEFNAAVLAFLGAHLGHHT